MRRDERAQAVFEATRSMELAREDGEGNRIELLRAPDLFYDKEGELVGVDAWVKMFNGDRELRVDPHRIFVNPPTHLVTDTGIELAPDTAFWDVLWDSVLGVPNPRGWRTKGTVTTVFANAADGTIHSNNAVYATARTGGTLALDPVGTSFMLVGQGTGFNCYESFVNFDTSSITDSDIVSSVVLDLFGSLDNSDTDFTVNARDFNWGATLTTGDWVSGASLSSNTLVATFATSGFSASGYNTFTSQAAFLTVTNLKTGTVSLILSSSRHEGNNTPTGDEEVRVRTAETSGTTQDPKLTITHTAVGSAAFYTSRPNRIWRRR